MNIKNLLKFGMFSTMLVGGLTFGANSFCEKCGAALTCAEGNTSICRSCEKACCCSECEKDEKSQEIKKDCITKDCEKIQTLEQNKDSEK